MVSQGGMVKSVGKLSAGRDLGIWFTFAFFVGSLLLAMGVVFVYFKTQALAENQATEYLYQDIAGRQRVIAQRIQTNLYTIGYRLSQHLSPDDAQLDLFQATTIFQSTLQVLLLGGPTQDTSGSVVIVPPLTDTKASAVVRSTRDRWRPLQQSLERIGASKSLDLGHVTPVISQGDEAIADLIDQSIELTARIDTLANEQTETITWQRTLSVVVAVLGFLVILAGFFARLWRDKVRMEHTAEELSVKNATLSEYSAQLSAGKQGTDAIMETVRQGLFLIDKDFIIQGEYSTELEAIFEKEDLEGCRLVDLMRPPLLSEKLHDVTRRYFVILFDQSKRDRAVLQANPLDPIDLNFPNPKGGYRTKSVSFTFRRLRVGDQITRVFVSATDITERMQLEQEMRTAEQRKERQLMLMFDLVQADQKSLSEFVTTMQRDINEIDSTLRSEDFADRSGVSQPVLRTRLDAIYRCVHNIKGNAALVNIEAISQSANTFENKLAEIKSRKQTTGDDFLSAKDCLTELKTYLIDVTELREKLSGMERAGGLISAGVRAKALPITRSSGRSLESLHELGDRIAKEFGKEVEFDTDRFDEHALSQEIRGSVKDVLVQLVRNSIFHGIELPAERREHVKNAAGLIEIWTERDRIAPQTVSVVYRDDGRGLDSDKILALAVERGLVSQEEREEFRGDAAIRFIFEPGFSTAEDSTMHAGRGVGLDIVRHLIVDQNKGQVAVDSVLGRYCKFTFTFITDPAPVASFASH
ncbi:MAG TPA: ATP-binding protein [Candidatus Baltobacteraceae bacterium]|jgi:HPt (histidine-containing phosphotransfer) domain-containing protein|nr:ATP-binding protein [Candidatus Baltobacteraceae bacterium]